MSLLTKASMVMTPNAIKSNKVYSIIPSNGNGDLTFTRDTAATQINSSGNVENVLTTIPRLNYDSIGGCPSLLLEPQRMNLALQSEAFDTTSWTKVATTIIANSIVSPSGVQNADTFTANGVSGFHYIYNFASVSSGITYSISIYAKKGTNNFIQLAGGTSAFGTNFYANFDLNNGVLGTVGSTATASIKSVGNGWYRCTITGATINAIVLDALAVFAIVQSATSVRAEANILTTNIYLWGAQIELGSYPTSYIPTTTSAVTRNQDISSKSGITDLIGQTEGVMFIESAALFNDLTSRGISISDGTLSNILVLRYNNASNQLLAFVIVSGVISNTIAYNLTDETQFAKMAVRYRVNDISLWVNGANRGTITSQALPPNLSRFGFDRGDGTFPFYGKAKQVQLYKTYLTDTEMTNLTTL